MPAGSGTATGYITLDGYEGGRSDTRRPSCRECAKISQKQLINVHGVRIDGKSHLVVQDFEIEECNIAVVLRNDAAYIKVRRNIIHDTLDDGLLIAESDNA